MYIRQGSPTGCFIGTSSWRMVGTLISASKEAYWVTSNNCANTFRIPLSIWLNIGTDLSGVDVSALQEHKQEAWITALPVCTCTYSEARDRPLGWIVRPSYSVYWEIIPSHGRTLGSWSIKTWILIRHTSRRSSLISGTKITSDPLYNALEIRDTLSRQYIHIRMQWPEMG